MQLSTSDWVTIGATAVSVASSTAVAIGVAVWQVKKAARAGVPRSAREPVLAAETRKWLIAQLWPFATSTVVALILIIGPLLTDGPVTRSFVISFVCGCFLLAFSLICAALFAVAAAFRPTYFALENLSAKYEARPAKELIP